MIILHDCLQSLGKNRSCYIYFIYNSTENKRKNIQTELKLPPHGSGIFYRKKKVKEIVNYFDLLIGGNQIWN